MNRLRFCIAVFVLIFCVLAYANPVAQDYVPLTLLGRSHAEAFAVDLDNADWRWLRNKKLLVIGISLSDSPPLNLVSDHGDYEGVTADYIELLGDLLHIDIQVRRYENRDLAIRALKRGELDLLGAAGTHEAADSGLLLSQPYINDQMVLATNSERDNSLNKDLAGQRLAMARYYAEPERIQALYPEAQLNLYPTELDAISAVAFGQADAYVGGVIASSYLKGRNFFKDIRLKELANQKLIPIGFALTADNGRLLHIVNHALASIPATESLSITRRWGLHSVTAYGLDKVNLSTDELRWLAAHPRLKIAIIEDNPPLSFFDHNNVFRGLNADLLEKISQRISLRFEVVRAQSIGELADLVHSGKADLMAAFYSEGVSDKLRYTRPYMISPFVFVSRAGEGEPRGFEDMSGKRLAISRRSFWYDEITRRYPGITLVAAESRAEQMALVAQNKVDATINTLISSRYLISTFYRDRLRINRTVGDRPAQLGLGMDRSALELYSILDKTLRSFSPEELAELTDRWRSEVMLDNRGTRASQRTFIKWLVVAVALLLVAAGWIIYLRRLIYKRAAAERALNEQMEFMRVLIDGLPHPIYVRDCQTRLLLCNSRYLEMTKLSREELIGTTLTEAPFTEVPDIKEFQEQYLELIETGKTLIQDRQIRLPNGQSITAYHWILPFRDTQSEVKGIIAGWIDISEREQLLGELKEAKQEAEQANRAKTTFLATMSHEIRTPINAVVGMLELAMKRADQGVLDRFAIEVALGAARELLEMLSDILDVVRIESGRLTLNPQRAVLKELVEAVFRVQEGMARQKNLALVLEFDEQANRDVLVDPVRFKQVLANLLSNAIKFTVKGEVLVSVKARVDEDNQTLGIRLLVRDTGIGISAEDQLKLFAPFSQVGTDTHSAAGGSGLGLNICRTLCTMMGGELNLSSVLGLGTQTEVLVSLPILEPLPMSQAEPVVPQPGKELNVLVVDDYPANRLLLTQQLSYLGHRVRDEQDGAHGLRTWRNNQFDVVITDCNMPVMSGYEMAKAIRADEAASGKLPCLILGFTANAQPEEIDRCLAAGMDDCLFKPISMKDLSVRLSGVEPAFKPVAESDEAMPAVDDIDLSRLEQLTYGDRESINSLLQDLISSNEEDLQRLLKLFSQNNLPGLADLAHRVKGGARIIQARRLIQCCEQLQADCNGLNAVRLTQSVDTLHQEMEALAQVLKRYIEQPVD
ncbi:transporter substrate-binding domain-containing protein [Pseudomonas aeruginosa]|uniref:transporter substrate-binding domain-containing protein n=1 Tax=Pseudomonas aeruginosa TaxID=287 RepID=UPI000EB26E0E|nr:transporter substrate-binding domain-containing protein [Pseudomonas aeruginosa]MCS8292639.1 transporter substrate-binding domain-containing protein [Pseudomonas aeruginosa]MCS9421378.1 transporter substrate-binding domain-containing protein [Pseudomonas aeruginosa]MCS9547038.1 transporter substrate-binding domain-containing protein [Pseudomonas aeruginosa]HCE6227865.1 transporter substrate-binding domain-containing protein [Pseudomonas aeruginosa]HCW0238788.1 transporter substrate-binding 